MSKTSKRKSSEVTSKTSKSLSSKDSHKRPSVFERLGTKATSLSVNTLSLNTSNQAEICRNWAQNGSCPFGKTCKLSYSHILISPSKRSSKKDIDLEKRVQNSLLCRGSPSEVGVDWESWDQSELEYEDEKALERRRQLLQRELELQIKKEIQRQESNKHHSSSSSESSSSSSSSSSSDSTSDSSANHKKKIELKSVTTSYLERSIIKKNMGKGIHKESPPRKSSTSKKVSPPRKPRRKSMSPVRKPALSPQSKSKPAASSRNSDRGTRRNDSPIGSRGRTPDRKQTGRSSGSSRRSPRPSVTRRGRSPRPRPPSRNRSPDRRKEDDRRSKDDNRRNDRKSDFRDKRDAAREKERVEALERCRERQREREALAKERERERKERDKRRRSYGSSRRSPLRDEKRHDKKAERDRSYSRERARDRALERVMERRGSSRERSYERPYSQNSPSYRGGGSDRNRYGNERLSPERSSTRDDRRGRRWLESREKTGNHEWSEHVDWENRSSRCEERGEEWCSYNSSISGNGEWRSRSHLSHHDDRRSHHADKEKDHSVDLQKGDKEQKETSMSSSKRSCEEIDMEIKRSRLEEVSLQEELSDISDDPDDILNREDTEFVDQEVVEDETRDGSFHESVTHIHGQEEGSQPLTPGGDRNGDSRIAEDDAIVSLDFEEISDEELEEESKCNKGISVVDALGVDWASLVAEWRPSREISKRGSARKNWSSSAIFRRIKISKHFAGDQLVEHLLNKHLSEESVSNVEDKNFSSDILKNKQALSARADIVIRRQLCGLPVITSEAHPTTGFCQWAV